MSILKGLFRSLVTEYDLYWIYESQADSPVVALPPGTQLSELSALDEIGLDSGEMKSLRSYLLEDSRCFVLKKGDRIASGCVYWWNPTYALHRGFWNLGPNDAKLVQIITDPSCRGLGLASALISISANQMRQSGFQRLFARIWHSNAKSIRAFEKAGWRRIAFRGRFLVPMLGERSFTRLYRR